MPEPREALSPTAALARIDTAAAQGKLSAGAVEHLRRWLTEPRYAAYAPLVAEHVHAEKWQVLDDVFFTIIPFGTGGRRGKMYPIGSNAINDRTIGESAKGLADYVKEQQAGPTTCHAHASDEQGYAPAVADTAFPRKRGHATPGVKEQQAEPNLSCAIAYDTRHRSRHFAELCAEVMVAAGLRVQFLDGYRSTPELSFAIRHLGCSCGIMVTASHNPPSDNAVKAYWSTGGQLLPPHDKGVIERVMNVATIERTPFAEALADGRIRYCQEEVDVAYVKSVAAQSQGGPRELKVIYSPMHGVGASCVVPVLAAAGFKDVEIFGPHASLDGDFPNVPGHVANPENPATFDSIIVRATAAGADVILSTDPDADRLGCAAPVSPGGAWKTFTGNQIAALMTEFLLSRRKAAGTLRPDQYVVKTIVTSEMIRRIAHSYGVRTYGNLMVGFKWIAGLMDDAGPDRFLLGAEESHGYLVGEYARDKDAAVAALLIAELAAEVKAKGQTLHQKLDDLFWQYGCHAERTVSKTMPGSEGMARILSLMSRLRTAPPTTLAGMQVRQIHDYEQQTVVSPSADQHPLESLPWDLVVLDLDEGNSVAIRPSGTEPKVKFYIFAYEPPELLANLEDTKAELDRRIDHLERDLAAYADA